MKSGAELIAIERQEQIDKHGRTIERDVKENTNNELAIAAMLLLDKYPSAVGFPENWDQELVQKMISKPYKDRLIIAGAFIAAEFDRVEILTKNNN